MGIIDAGASWLHVLAAVAVLGYYAVLGLVVVPAIRESLDGPRVAATVAAVERRALPWLVAGVVVFVATGALLMLTSSRYTGLGTFFATTWAVLIVVKHAVIAAIVVIAAVIDLIVIPDAVTPESETGRGASLARLRRLSIVVTLLGALVLLLTAAAQAS